MTPLATPAPERPDPEAATSAREVRRFNRLFMLANATFLLITWCCLQALA
ncbi:MAG: hypothetical protein ICV83_05080 [Cytophagales bacterium]|nr:hypothetical protein [Cytophagales bacterium]